MTHDEQEDHDIADARAALASIGAMIGDLCGGTTPVQIDGVFQGAQFYFRSRGSHWRIWIGPGAHVLRDADLYEEAEYRPEGVSDEDARYIAGYMPLAEALALVRTSLERWAGLRA